MEIIKKHRNDLVLLLVMLVIAGAAWFVVYVMLQKPGSCVTVTIDGRERYNLPLQEDTEVLIEGEEGSYNILQIRDGKASVTEADCPDKLCVHQHAISMQGETIVCLPHKMVVEVTGMDEDGVDGVSR